MRKTMLSSIVLTMAAIAAFGQSAGDYRSAASGNWNTTATWQYYNGTAWVAATSTPTNASGAITIRSPHVVTVTANVTVDQVVVEAGGQVTVNNIRTLTIANGAGTDFVCNGTLYNNGTVTPTGTLEFSSGGTYQHARNGGTIPTATWDVASTCLVTGITNSTPPGGLGQAFGNFTWNCTNQGANYVDANELVNINGDLTIISTGTTGRLNNSGGDMTVVGNYNQSGGTFNPGSGYGTAQRFFLGGNFNQTGGTFRNNTGGGQLIVVFNGGNQTFYSSGIMQNIIDFNIRPGTMLTLNSNLPVNSGATTATLTDSGVLYTGNYLVTGGGVFTLPAGGTLGIGSAEGITALGTAAGNIQTIGARNYSTSGNYIYNGSATQVTGSGLPSSVNNLTIDNAAGAILTNSVTVNGTLGLTNGILTTGSNTVTISGTGSVSRSNGWVNGNLAKAISTGPQTKTFEVGTANGFSPVEVTFADVITAGTLTARAVQSVHPNVAIPINCLQRYWTLTNSGIAFTNYNATFTYLPGDFNLGFIEAADEAAMVVGKYGPWSLPTIGMRSPGSSGDGGSIQVTGLTSFSDFTMAKDGGSLDGALAVSLANFTALATDGAISLSWRTESESGSYQWIVERSDTERGPYIEMGRLPAAGNSATPRDYSWADRTVRAGAAYWYRIGELSQDGGTTYFGPVSCSLGRGRPQADLALGCAPNPFRSQTGIRYQVSQTSPVSLSIYNVSGQLVRGYDLGVQPAGYYQATWDGQDLEGRKLSAGVYLYRITIGGRQFGGKVMMVR